MWFIILLTCILWLIGVAYLGFVVYYSLSRREVFVPFVPADSKGIDAMCDALQLSGKEKTIDIGSGWGTIVFHLSNKFPKLPISGVELNPILHGIASLRKMIFHAKSPINLLRDDAVNLNYSQYQVIFLFMLSPFVNKILVPKFEKELKKGTKVVSYVFPMTSSHFKETKIQLPSHNWKSTVYIYEKV